MLTAATPIDWWIPEIAGSASSKRHRLEMRGTVAKRPVPRRGMPRSAPGVHDDARRRSRTAHRATFSWFCRRRRCSVGALWQIRPKSVSEPEVLRGRTFKSWSLRESRFVGCDLGDVVASGGDVAGMEIDSPWPLDGDRLRSSTSSSPQPMPCRSESASTNLRGCRVRPARRPRSRRPRASAQGLPSNSANACRGVSLASPFELSSIRTARFCRTPARDGVGGRSGGEQLGDLARAVPPCVDLWGGGIAAYRRHSSERWSHESRRTPAVADGRMAA